MKTTEIKVVGYESNVTPTGLNETKITAEVAENVTAEVHITTGRVNDYSVSIFEGHDRMATIYSDEERTVYEARKSFERKSTTHNGGLGWCTQLFTTSTTYKKIKEYKSVNKAYIAALAENGLTYEGIIEISNAMIEKMIEIREENAVIEEITVSADAMEVAVQAEINAASELADTADDLPPVEIKVPEPVFTLQTFNDTPIDEETENLNAKFEEGETYWFTLSSGSKTTLKVLKVKKGYLTYYDDIEDRNIRRKIDNSGGTEHFEFDKYWHIFVSAGNKLTVEELAELAIKECTYWVKWLKENAEVAQVKKIRSEVLGLWEQVQAAEVETADEETAEVESVDVQIDSLKSEIANLETQKAELERKIETARNKILEHGNTIIAWAYAQIKPFMNSDERKFLIKYKKHTHGHTGTIYTDSDIYFDATENGSFIISHYLTELVRYFTAKQFKAAVTGFVDAIKRGDEEYIFPENK